jgi:two-component sensor histidine kinase
MDVGTAGQPPPDLFITHELGRRAEKAPDYLEEKRALQELAIQMLDHPEQVLPRFVELAMKMTGGFSSGISLYEADPAPGVFRWKYLQGILSPFDDVLTPRNFSPCGITLDQNSPILCLHPERYYSWVSDAGIVLPEVLLVPLRLGGAEPLGTLWIVAESEGHFDAGHARVATELAGFAGIALRMSNAEKQLQKSLDEQETVAQEMGHRVKNLFMIASSLVRLTARNSDTKEEMAERLLGRFDALATAHGLVRRSFLPDREDAKVQDFGTLLRAITLPHERPSPLEPRFTFSGPSIDLGDHALNGVALIINELTTNAVKYGPLAGECGQIAVKWYTDGNSLVVRWLERGGPKIANPPESLGFGSKLLRGTVARLGGKLEHDWGSDGLSVRIALPLASLSA